MAVNTTLTMGVAGKGTLAVSKYSSAKVFHDVTYPIKDTSVADKLKPIIAFDPSGNNSTSDLSKFNALLMHNSGNQTLEVQVTYYNFYNSDADTKETNPDRIVMLMHPNDFMYFPTSKIINYVTGADSVTKSASFKTGTGGNGANPVFLDPDAGTSDRSDGKTRTAAGVVASSALIDMGGDLNATATAITIDPGSTSGNLFRVNDLIKIDNEIMLVTGITSGTVIAVKRAVAGTTGATHTNNSVINHYYLNEIGDSAVYTNRNGFYSANTFFAYGRTTAEPSGIVPGSVTLSFPDPAYQEFGMTGVTSNTDSGLTASTAYAFDLTLDNNASATTISFTTDSSNTKWGGANGILSKINSQFIAKYKDNTFKILPSISIINGDVRVTSGSRISGTTAGVSSKIVLAAPTSGTTIFGVNRIPAIGDIRDSIVLTYPLDYEYSKFAYDDGKGSISGASTSGTINYDTGAIRLNSYPNCQFKISAYYNNALSGEVSSGRGNYILNIYAKSVNPFRDGLLRVMAYDDGTDDSTLFSPTRGYRR